MEREECIGCEYLDNDVVDFCLYRDMPCDEVERCVIEPDEETV